MNKPTGPEPANYLCVFHADPGVDTDVIDAGSDPDFSPPSPTWGICRPNLRRAVVPGSGLVFVGYYRASRTYYLKGWFDVGEVIGYEDALYRFPTRRNVIVSRAYHLGRQGEVAWKRDDLRVEVEKRHGLAPQFLTRLRGQSGWLTQNPLDDHEIDNWKCQRMFGCGRRQFLACNEAGACLREQEFPGLTGYVIAKADSWLDTGRRRKAWLDVAPASLAGLALRTRYGQHNPRRISRSQVEQIVAAANG
jgi:hypothetical protein